LRNLSWLFLIKVKFIVGEVLHSDCPLLLRLIVGDMLAL